MSKCPLRRPIIESVTFNTYSGILLHKLYLQHLIVLHTIVNEYLSSLYSANIHNSENTLSNMVSCRRSKSTTSDLSVKAHSYLLIMLILICSK